jgi:MoaA/NifB/PqqE/SkfB family radical SAM enzyme
MDFNIIKQVVEEMSPRGLREIIPSTMGEPLMYEHFLDIVDLCKEHNLKLNLTTNGSFIGRPKSRPDIRSARDWARELVPVCSDVKISWNSATKEVQERVMKKSKFDEMVKNLQAFMVIRDSHAAKGGNYCSVTLQATFMEDNLEGLPDLVRFAIDRGCDRVKGHQLWTHGFPELESQSLRRSPESRARWNKIVRECHRIAQGADNEKLRLENFDLLDEATGATIPNQADEEMDQVVASYQATPGAPNNGNDTAVASSTTMTASFSTSLPPVCPFLGRELWVNWEGKVSPCCAPDLERQALGDFGKAWVEQGKGKDVMTVWQSEQYQNLVRTYYEKPLCKTCTMRKPPVVSRSLYPTTN